MNTLKKSLLSLSAALLVPAQALAAASIGLEVGGSTGLGTRDLKETIVRVVNVILGFLGILAVLLILYGGFKWMTAAGNEEKVGEAKKVIGAGIVGLVVILTAYAVAQFVISNLQSATN